MTGDRVFVNERPVTVSAGATALDAVMVLDPELARLVGESGAYLTDGVGRRIDPTEPLSNGAILRVVRSVRGEKSLPNQSP